MEYKCLEQNSIQIDQLYKTSLSALFEECLLVNLTDNYFVNCHKDTLRECDSEDMDFTNRNSRYAKEFIHPEDAADFSASFSGKAMLSYFGEEKKKIVKRYRRKQEDDTYHMVEFTAARISHPSEQCWCMQVCRDIHEEYLQEQSLNMEISHLATAARIACQMLIAVNLTQNSYYMMEYDRFATKKAAITGIFDELIEVGASTVDAAFREEFIKKFSRASLLAAFERGVQNVTMELRQLGDDGKYHWNLTQAVRINSPYTNDIMEITMTKDIDEERRQQEESIEKEKKAKLLLEEALQKAEKASHAKSDFLSKMSHDIRTPMNSIMGLTILAQMHVEDSEKIKEYLALIEASGRHLQELINEVLDMSMIESGKIEGAEAPCNLNRLLQDAAMLVQPAVSQKEQNLSINIEDNVYPYVMADKQKISQIVINILENACKYTGFGGHICLGLVELDKSEKQIGRYQITIEDNGIGMTEDYLEHIFEPFSRAVDSRTSKIPGTGLGMTIVYNLVNKMGGDITVKSQYGKGSQFLITICLEKTKAVIEEAQEAVVVTDDALKGIKVLLVEDNDLNRDIVMEILSYMGAHVETAQNGREAADAVLQKEPFYYDIVLMDIQMPIMDGYKAAAAIRSSGKEGTETLPIIAMTADTFTEDIKRTRQAGMNDHMTKPINLKSLLTTIKTNL